MKKGKLTPSERFERRRRRAARKRYKRWWQTREHQRRTIEWLLDDPPPERAWTMDIYATEIPLPSMPRGKFTHIGVIGRPRALYANGEPVLRRRVPALSAFRTSATSPARR